ncbi:MAG: hypothetical protein U0822_09935 [Anaerolineae bacterium]
MLRPLAYVFVMILVGGVALGFSLAKSDLLNPNTSAAETRRMDALTDAYKDDHAFEAQRRQVELNQEQQEFALKLQHERDRQALDLQLTADAARQRADVLSVAFFVLVLAAALGIVAVCAGLGYYLVCRGRAYTLARLNGQGAPSQIVAPPSRPSLVSPPGQVGSRSKIR